MKCSRSARALKWVKISICEPWPPPPCRTRTRGAGVCASSPAGMCRMQLRERPPTLSVSGSEARAKNAVRTKIKTKRDMGGMSFKMCLEMADDKNPDEHGDHDKANDPPKQ